MTEKPAQSLSRLFFTHCAKTETTTRMTALSSSPARHQGINHRRFLYLLILIQPLIDNYYLLEGGHVEWFGMSPATFVRFGMVALLGVWSLWLYGWDRLTTVMCLYGLFCLAYTVLHLWTNRSFHTLLTTDPYRVTQEIAYILRLLVPILLIWVTYRARVPKGNSALSFTLQ